jgi:hypothetical protein
MVLLLKENGKTENFQGTESTLGLQEVDMKELGAITKETV